jgi:hypothetical protein
MSPSIRIGFRVRAVDGECQPVPDLEIGARFHYPASPSTWSVEQTDAEGYARFDDEHPEAPREAHLFVGGEHCGTITPVEAGGCHIVEL